MGGVPLLRSYMGITISHYKDPDEPTSIKGCHNGLNVAQLHQLLISGEFCDLATDS